ncbi:MAG TPA: PKD domain-containing protein [Thermoplasmata archaeon]|nr:PKD domain-containing protein [Thermoplasmata archaeon]
MPPLNVSFELFPYGGTTPYYFAWEFGDGNRTSNTTFSTIAHLYVRSGNFTFTFWVNDSGGDTFIGSSTVVVEPAPLDVETPTVTPSTVEAGGTATFQTNASGGYAPYRYFWLDAPPGCPDTQLPTLVCLPNASGTFRVSVIAADAFGVEGESSGTANLTVVAGPTVTSASASPAVIDIGETTVVAAEIDSPTGSATFIWTGLPLGCSAGDGSTFSCTPAEIGTFMIGFTATDAGGGSVTGALALTVDTYPGAVGISFSHDPVDLGESLHVGVFPEGGTPPFAYRWTDLPAGCSAAPASSIACMPNATGNYTVSVSMTDAAGVTFSAASATPLRVNPSPTGSLRTVPATPVAGSAFEIGAAVSGGSPAFVASFENLPPGCLFVSGLDANCTVALSGSYNVMEKLVDRAGWVLTLNLSLTIAPPTPPSYAYAWQTLAYWLGALVAGAAIVGGGNYLRLRWLARRGRPPRAK